jgi:hypothetical protein
MSWKIDTTTTDEKFHAGVYTLTITATTPYTLTEFSPLVITYSILEICDPPQLTWVTTQFTTPSWELMRTVANIVPTEIAP